MTRVLLVEDDTELSLCLADNLEREGYAPEVVADGSDALRRALAEEFQLVLLDVMLPGLDGFAVCRAIRLEKPELPIIVISARAAERDKITGFELGADDYVTKPFGVAELLARMRALLRRTTKTLGRLERVAIGDAAVDFVRREAVRHGKTMRLTSQECTLLRLLLAHENDAVPRAVLVRRIWGYDPRHGDRSVDRLIVRLRRKLERDARAPQHILTLYGEGYSLVR